MRHAVKHKVVKWGLHVGCCRSRAWESLWFLQEELELLTDMNVIFLNEWLGWLGSLLLTCPCDQATCSHTPQKWEETIIFANSSPPVRICVMFFYLTHLFLPRHIVQNNVFCMYLNFYFSFDLTIFSILLSI